MLEVPDHPEIAGEAVPVYAATYYNETSRKLVLVYKHGGRIALVRLLARLIAARMPEPAAGRAPPLLVPVPLHRWRLWSRGFNQAALLARELAGDAEARGEQRIGDDALPLRARGDDQQRGHEEAEWDRDPLGPAAIAAVAGRFELRMLH